MTTGSTPRCEINRWLAIREECGAIDQIEDELRAWRYPEREHEWPLGVAALLNDVPACLRLVGEARRRDQHLTRERRWPLVQLLAERHPEVLLVPTKLDQRR